MSSYNVQYKHRLTGEGMLCYANEVLIRGRTVTAFIFNDAATVCLYYTPKEVEEFIC